MLTCKLDSFFTYFHPRARKFIGWMKEGQHNKVLVMVSVFNIQRMNSNEESVYIDIGVETFWRDPTVAGKTGEEWPKEAVWKPDLELMGALEVEESYPDGGSVCILTHDISDSLVVDSTNLECSWCHSQLSALQGNHTLCSRTAEFSVRSSTCNVCFQPATRNAHSAVLCSNQSFGSKNIVIWCRICHQRSRIRMPTRST